MERALAKAAPQEVLGEAGLSAPTRNLYIFLNDGHKRAL